MIAYMTAPSGAASFAPTTSGVAADTGWTANSTAGDKTAQLAAYTNAVTGTQVTALNGLSASTGTAISAGFDALALVVKKLAAIETALAAGVRPNA